MSSSPIGIPYIQLTTDDLKDPSLQRFNEQQRQIYLAIQALGKAVTTPAAATTAFADGIVPSGAINGRNKIFTLPNAPSPASSLTLFLTGTNGKFLVSGTDYTLSKNTITLKVAPVSGQGLVANYRYVPSS